MLTLTPDVHFDLDFVNARMRDGTTIYDKTGKEYELKDKQEKYGTQRKDSTQRSPKE